MRLSILILAVYAVTTVLFAGCSKRTVMSPFVMPSPECVVSKGGVEAVDTITVALLDDINPGYAPVAVTDGDRLLFHHLYETLLTVDCLGRVHAGLAGEWRGSGGGRIWTFKMREEARFWDGTPVTAEDVIRNWRRSVVRKMAAAAGIDSTGIAGDHGLRVYFDRPHREVPLVLSSLEFAVVKHVGEGLWPKGSGLYRIEAHGRTDTGESGRTVTCVPIPGRGGPVIRFIVKTAYDTRDLLEGVTDMMVTSDPAVIEYASGRPEFTTVALPWNRTYVLLAPSRILEILRGGEIDRLSPELLDGFARDAVRGDARGHRSPSWWETLDECGVCVATVEDGPPVPRVAISGSGPRRILYEMKDTIARDLAERIVALAAADTAMSKEAAELANAVPGLVEDRFGMVMVGKTGRELKTSIREGNDFAYIIPVSCLWTDPCYEARKLRTAIPWLCVEGIDLAKAMIPLVDTRRYVIADRGNVEPVLDYNGDIFITNGVSQER